MLALRKQKEKRPRLRVTSQGEKMSEDKTGREWSRGSLHASARMYAGDGRGERERWGEVGGLREEVRGDDYN